MKIIGNNKLLLKILSAMIAVILWTAITYSEDPVINQALNGISVEFAGEEELHNKGLIVTNKDSIPAISAVIRGNRSRVISSIGAISAVADVSGIDEAGSNNVKIEYSYPSSAVSLVKTKITEITVKTEKIVSRSVPVVIEAINQDKNPDNLIESTSRIKTIKIKGAESEVYKISYAKAQVDAESVLKTSSQDYVYKFYDEKDNVIPDTNILYRSYNAVSVENTVYKRTTLPVSVILGDEFAEDYGVNVKSISKAAVDVGLADGVNLQSIQAVITDIASEGGKYELTLEEPEGVYIPEKSRKITVSCEIMPKIIKEIEVPLTVQNLPEGKNYELFNSKVKVSVKGSEKELTADKIKAIIDAQKSADGKNHVQITVEVQDGMTVVGSYGAEIEIKSQG